MLTLMLMLILICIIAQCVIARSIWYYTTSTCILLLHCFWMSIMPYLSSILYVIPHLPCHTIRHLRFTILFLTFTLSSTFHFYSSPPLTSLLSSPLLTLFYFPPLPFSSLSLLSSPFYSPSLPFPPPFLCHRHNKNRKSSSSLSSRSRPIEVHKVSSRPTVRVGRPRHLWRRRPQWGMASCHMWCHVMSYHLLSCHVLSWHVTLHYMTSHCIKWHHIALYDIV